MTNFEMDLFDTRMNTYLMEKEKSEGCCRTSPVRPACLPVTLIAIILTITFFVPIINEDSLETPKYERTGVCTDQCRLEVVESIPTGVNFPGHKQNPSTFSAWSEMLRSAEKSVDLAVFYWNLRDGTGYPTANEGNETFYHMIDAARRGVKIRIAQSTPTPRFPQTDSKFLAENGLAEVRNLDFTAMFGSGVLHTKFWIVDQKHVYIGSANMDWKSLTEVKELGVVVSNCSCTATDLTKIFTVYWRLGEDSHIPARWPLSWGTRFNTRNPLRITYDGIDSHTFISSAPREFNPKGREFDLEAITFLMGNASRYIRVAVMDYMPETLYMPNHTNRYWPAIDDAIRAAAYRGVRIELLISHWNHSRPEMPSYLKSLLQLNGAYPISQPRIAVKTFIVPATKQQASIPFARVNHNKYMVTDKAAFIGTSNWAGDYFISTAGVSFVVQTVENPAIVNRFNEVFLRDWNSTYAVPLTL
ncbi:Protein F09G2.8 a [Aphelenchoides avenae]|nr:Protein F09G2.8 a [Aphelenchus avenae]